MEYKKPQRAIIIVNGSLPELEIARRYIQPGDRLICADGGAHHAQALGLVPDVVIGDMDSLSPALRQELTEAGVRFAVYPVDKDETDLELALQLAINEGATQIELLAVLGGRLDQSLANLMLLARPEWRKVQIRAITGNEMAWPVCDGQQATISGQAGDTLSLIPLSPTVTGVTLTGVQWPLEEASLQFGSTWTISNVLTTSEAHLQVGSGIVLVIHQHNSEW